MNVKYFNIAIIITLSMPALLKGQPYIVDNIVGVVGKNQILYSDVEDQYLQMMAQGVKPMPSKCQIFEEILAQKLLVNQASIDSLVLEEGQVEMELNDRINYFVQQIGSEQQLVEHFGKSVIEIKEDMRDLVRDQMLMQMMRREITSGLSVTPAEVRNYFNHMNPDSIPFIDSEVEINQIWIYPASSEQSKFEVRERLLGIRERIVGGDNFSSLAVLYSEGSTATRGGDMGWVAKADLDPAYAKAAFALKAGQVSKIVETPSGFYLIQLIERIDERIHVREILMRPKITFEAKLASQNKLDSIVNLVKSDSMTFEQAAVRFSQDEDTRANGGLMVNPYSGNTRFGLEQLNTKEHYIIRNLNVNDISEIYESVDAKGNLAYKVVRLKSKTEPHRANLKQDYELLKQITTQQKQNEIVDEWLADKIKSTYIRISEPYSDCDFRLKGWK